MLHQILLTNTNYFPTATTTPGQSGPGSNVIEGVLHTPENSQTRTSPLNAV